MQRSEILSSCSSNVKHSTGIHQENDVKEEEEVERIRFTGLFFEKYFPDCFQNQLEIEFLELKQGEKSVSEYEAKFSKLVRLVPSRFVALQLKTYPSVVQSTLVIESDQKLAVKEKGDKKRKSESITDKADQEESSLKFPKWFGRNRDKRFRRQGFPQVRPSATSVAYTPAQSVMLVVECKLCGKRHSGQCRKDVQCLKCDQKGH
ncbi:hypothetical protein AgCh_011821 [Apium graveolens]